MGLKDGIACWITNYAFDSIVSVGVTKRLLPPRHFIRAERRALGRGPNIVRWSGSFTFGNPPFLQDDRELRGQVCHARILVWRLVHFEDPMVGHVWIKGGVANADFGNRRLVTRAINLVAHVFLRVLRVPCTLREMDGRQRLISSASAASAFVRSDVAVIKNSVSVPSPQSRSTRRNSRSISICRFLAMASALELIAQNACHRMVVPRRQERLSTQRFPQFDGTGPFEANNSTLTERQPRTTCRFGFAISARTAQGPTRGPGMHQSWPLAVARSNFRSAALMSHMGAPAVLSIVEWMLLKSMV
jgi:hypothetical protein